MQSVAYKDLLSVHQKSVLIVDDELEMQLFLSRLLEFFGCKVDFASNCGEAVTKTQHAHYDVVIMDLHDPAHSGECGSKTLRDEGFKGAIIGLTPELEPGSVDEIDSTGFDEMLTKPVDRIALLSTIGELS